MDTRRTVLLIDNSSLYLDTVKEWLETEGYHVYAASTLEGAKQILATASVQIIVTDLRATNDRDVLDRSGLDFARSVAPTIPKIILTRFPDYATVRDALKFEAGSDLPAAVDFISKSEGPVRLSEAIDKALKKFVRSNYSQFKVGGALTDADAAVYVARHADHEVIALLQKMDYLLIIEPRQQGKTSLVNYLLRNPNLTETVLVYVDTATIDRSTQSSWYESLCTRLLDQLSRALLDGGWPNIPGTDVQWRYFLSDLAGRFEKSGRSLVIVLDEIGRVFPGASGFFSVLRDAFNSRQYEPQFRRLTFLLMGAFHPRDLVEDDTISPFNIAHRVRLPDFTLDQVRQLVSGVAVSNEQADTIAARVYHWTGGQPYLTQQLCAYLWPASTHLDVDDAVERFRREDENHLPPLLKRVNDNSVAREYLDQIRAGQRIKFYPAENRTQAQLELLGIIKHDGDGYCVLRNRIYENSFG